MQYRYSHTIVGAQVRTLIYNTVGIRKNSDMKKLHISLGIVLQSTLLQPVFSQCFASSANKMVFFLFSYEATKDSTYNLLPLAIT